MKTEKPFFTVLVVDDDIHVRNILCQVLRMFVTSELFKLHVLEADSVDSAKRILAKFIPAVVTTDFRMPGGTGLDLLDYLKSEPAHKDTPVILFSATLEDIQGDPRATGFSQAIQKPCKPKEFAETVRGYLIKR
ncbi:MAG: response regulator [bacterium]|nr:response regulator [bacterium]